MRVMLCVVATSVKLTLHTVAQTFLRFQVALVEATKTANRKRVQTAIVKLKSKVASCAMLFSPECVWCKPRWICVVWQGLDSRTKYRSQEASIVGKRRNHGAILFQLQLAGGLGRLVATRQKGGVHRAKWRVTVPIFMIW